MNEHRGLIFRSGAAFVAAITLTLAVGNIVLAYLPDYGFRFRHREFVVLEDRLTTTLLSDQVPYVISDYNAYSTSTHLTLRPGPIQQAPFIGNYSNIIYIERDMGPNGLLGHAFKTFSNGALCFREDDGWKGDSNGNCNTTIGGAGDHRADFAYEIFNSHEVNLLPHWHYHRYVAKHELGHSLGMKHPYTCPPASIMIGKYSLCSGYSVYDLQTLDVNTLIYFYP
jgi:hypothetical protein